MKSVAKWITILWSLFCLFGVLFGIAEVGEELNQPMDEYEEVGTGLGIGCGMFIWFFVWAAIAGPAFMVWTMSGKKEAKEEVPKESSLCSGCGKYYEGTPKFCPNCGNEV